MVHSFNYPARIKLNNVALFGEKESIDTIHDDLFLLRIIKDVSFSYLSFSKERYLLVSLSRYKEKNHKFVIVIPGEYEEKFVSCLFSTISGQNISFDFHYSHPTLLDALPAIDISVQEQDVNGNNNLHTIRKLLQFPLQLPILSDDIENKHSFDDCNSDTNVFHTSHIRICFHS